MAGVSSFPLADRLLDGRLADLLTELRDEGESYESIAFKLRDEHDIRISMGTVRRWCIELEGKPA